MKVNSIKYRFFQKKNWRNSRFFSYDECDEEKMQMQFFNISQLGFFLLSDFIAVIPRKIC